LLNIYRAKTVVRHPRLDGGSVAITSLMKEYAPSKKKLELITLTDKEKLKEITRHKHFCEYAIEDGNADSPYWNRWS